MSGKIIQRQISVIQIVGHLIELLGGCPLDIIRQHHPLLREHISPAVGPGIDPLFQPADRFIRKIADDMIRHALFPGLSRFIVRKPASRRKHCFACLVFVFGRIYRLNMIRKKKVYNFVLQVVSADLCPVRKQTVDQKKTLRIKLLQTLSS